MKRILCSLTVLLILGGCMRDDLDRNSGDGRERQVQISLTALTRGSEEGTDDGDEADRKVTSIRIMGFRYDNGVMAFNHLVEKEDFKTPVYTAVADVYTGRYDVVVVANERADETNLHNKLKVMTRGNNNISQLDALYLDYAGMDEDALNDVGIPMVSLVRNVTIQGSPTATKIIADGKEYSGTWVLDGDNRLARMLVRVRAAITLTATQVALLGSDASTIFFTNIPDKVYLLPRNNMPTAGVIASKDFVMTREEPIKEEDKTAGKQVATVTRALLPESLFANVSEKASGIRIALKQNGTLQEANLYSGTNNYTLPRNTFVDVTGTVADSGLSLFIDAMNWEEVVNGDGNMLNRQLNVSAREAYFIYETVDEAESQRIYFWSDQPGVYVEPTGYMGATGTTSTFTVDNVFTTLSGTSAANLNYTYSNGSGSGYIDLEPKLMAGGNTGRIVLNAGGLRKEILISVIAYGDTDVSIFPSTLTPYVGAFWRAAETGERLIRLPGAGSTETLSDGEKGYWTAIVGDENDGKDWIVLDTRSSGDGNVWTTSVADVNESNTLYQPKNGGTDMVTGDATDLTPIYFRIGLKSTLASAEAAPRYGIVYLFYNNNTKLHKIYVRQGEAPDRLFRNNHPDDTYDGTNQRTLSIPYSPYNLTHPTFKNPANAAIGGVEAPIQPTAVADYFTDYPSQGGAFYNFTPLTGLATFGGVPHVYAYNPTYPVNAEPTVGWPGDYDRNYYWGGKTGVQVEPYKGKKVYELFETCPDGYRRPTDGSAANTSATSPTPDNSELGQSIWLNPPTGDESIDLSDASGFIVGYYADGFFDRRAISNAVYSVYATNMAVDADLPTVAYRGMLFYNPASSASLFFPANGSRGKTTIAISGEIGNYWSSSVGREYQTSIRPWYLRFSVPQYSHERTYCFRLTGAGYTDHAFGIRCVLDVENTNPDPDPDPDPEPGTEGIEARFAKSNIVMYLDYEGNRVLTFAESAADFSGKTVSYDKKDGSRGSFTLDGVSAPALTANVQGLHFRWGGLVGLSSSCAAEYFTEFDPIGDVVFWPAALDDYPAPQGDDWIFNDGEWEEPGLHVNYLGIEEIWEYETLFEMVDNYYVEDMGIGDICRYMSDQGWVGEGWRTPTYSELEQLISETFDAMPDDHYGVRFGSPSSGLWSFHAMVNPHAVYGDYYGFTPVANARLVGAGVTSADSGNQTYLTKGGTGRILLPAAGMRSFSSGSQECPGEFGFYWASSADGGGAGSCLLFDGETLHPNSNFERGNGFSVRCIRDE